jgi:hypothetical protein
MRRSSPITDDDWISKTAILQQPADLCLIFKPVSSLRPLDVEGNKRKEMVPESVAAFSFATSSRAEPSSAAASASFSACSRYKLAALIRL